MEIIVPPVSGNNNIKISGVLGQFDLKMSTEEISQITLQLSEVCLTAVEEDLSLVIQLSHNLFLSKIYCESIEMKMGIFYITLIDFSFFPSEEEALAKIMESELKKGSNTEQVTVTGL